jgi:hypothetical protein
VHRGAPARGREAPVVFGSFNNAMKLSPRTIALWARVVRAVPGAMLLLKAPSLRDAAVQARYTELFAAQGVAAERLVLRGPSGLAEMMLEIGRFYRTAATVPDRYREAATLAVQPRDTRPCGTGRDERTRPSTLATSTTATALSSSRRTSLPKAVMSAPRRRRSEWCTTTSPRCSAMTASPPHWLPPN